MMDEVTLFSVIVGGLLIIGVLFVGFSLFASFYDLDSFDGEGELGIDTDSIDDLGNSMEDASDAVFENFDMEGITTTITSWGIMIGAMIGIVFTVYVVTK